MEEYRTVSFKSFDDFFIREIKDGLRSFPDNDIDVPSPCDGRLTVYQITHDSVFSIKNSRYSVPDLLQNPELADEFSNGVCLIFRLSPDDYHRYCYIDDGEIITRKSIKGKLHTVKPIACQTLDVFCQNSREYTILETKTFGKIIQMEVGALLVGKICNHNISNSFKRGEEKGMFRFGGSTVILLFKKEVITVDCAIYETTGQGMETIVKMGSRIGGKQ